MSQLLFFCKSESIPAFFLNAIFPYKNLYNTLILANNHGYVPFVVIKIWFFPHSWLITDLYQEWHHWLYMWSRNYLPYRSSWVHPRFSAVRVARSLVFCVVFCMNRYLAFFSFRPLYLLSSDLSNFWLPLWYLQTVLACTYTGTGIKHTTSETISDSHHLQRSIKF